MGQEYRKKRVVLEQYSALEFEKDEISLNIRDAVISSGWEIKAPSPLQCVSSITTGVALQSHALTFLDYQKSGR